MGKRATGKTAFALFKLKNELKQFVDFQADEETKLVEKYDGELQNGFVMIADEEKRKQFIEEKKQLDNMDIDHEIVRVKIDPDAISDINIDEIEALNGFVDFD